MNLIECKIPGCFIIEQDVHKDKRGSFVESFNKKRFQEKTGLRVDFVQDNLSVSKKGVLRGLHFQRAPHAQSKLVRVLKGEVLDVIVDLRKESKTFGEHLKLKLGAKEAKAIFMPKGTAHGFLTLSEEAIFTYKCDSYYAPKAEGGIRYNDEDLAIDWGLSSKEIILSEKDSALGTFKAAIL